MTLIGVELATNYVTASDAAELLFEHPASEPGERPCLAVCRGGDAIEVPDLRSDVRFARFLARVSDARLAAVFPLPLRPCCVRVAS